MTGEQVHDGVMLKPALEQLDISESMILASKAYGSAENRQYISDQGAEYCIPSKKGVVIKTMKKVLFVVVQFRIGGVAKALVELLRNIEGKYDISLLCFEQSGHFFENIPQLVKYCL